MTLDFEWEQLPGRWETTDNYSMLLGRIYPIRFTDGSQAYIGIAALTDLDGEYVYRSTILGHFKTLAVAEQAVEEKLTEWYCEEAEEARAEQILYEQEQGLRR